MRIALFLFTCCVFAFKLHAATPTPSDSQKIILTDLNNGDTLKIGDTVNVQWVCIDNIIYVDIRLSPDKGKTWILLNGQSIAYYDTAQWQHFKWVIPERIRKSNQDTTRFLLAGNHDCLFRVENYSPKDKSEISVSAQPVTILAGSGIIRAGRRARQLTAFNINTFLSHGEFPTEGHASVRLFDARGRSVFASNAKASGLVVGVLSNEAHSVSEARKAAFMRRR